MGAIHNLLAKLGYVRLDEYGLLLTAEGRVLTNRTAVLDDGYGGRIVGWRDGDLAAAELAPWQAGQISPRREAPEIAALPLAARVVVTPPAPVAPPAPIAAAPAEEPEEDDWEWQIAAARARAATAPAPSVPKAPVPKAPVIVRPAAAKAMPEPPKRFPRSTAPIVRRETQLGAAVVPANDDKTKPNAIPSLRSSSAGRRVASKEK